MERIGHNRFKPELCASCGQTTEYPIRLDKGTAYIVIAIANAVRLKNKNRVHLRNEMLVKRGEYPSTRDVAIAGKMTATMIDNVLRAKYHGLVAQIDGGGTGEYLLTPKGARFLRGEAVPALAAIDKTKHVKKYYIDEETDWTTIGRILRGDTNFWDHAWDIDENTLSLKRRAVATREKTEAPLL